MYDVWKVKRSFFKSYFRERSLKRGGPQDEGNRYFYIRDEETGEYWNPGWYPVKRELDEVVL